MAHEDSDPSSVKPESHDARKGAALAGAFGAAVAMWAAGYFGRIPPPHGWLQPAALLIVLVAIQVGAGALLSRAGSTRLKTAILAGAGAGIINLLVLGALLREDHSPGDVALGAFGLIATCAALSTIGYALGRLARRTRGGSVNWTAALAFITLCGTFVLVIAGGLVTGHEAGLAVVDWPNTEGRLMFLYPLSRMTGGIYYEHAHRLYGALVGLTTLALAFQVWRAGPRHVRRLAIVAVVLVIAQGILGGLRVTGEFTLATEAGETRPNLALAIVHGVLAQIFLAITALITAMSSTAWHQDAPVAARTEWRKSRRLAFTLVALLFVQLILGACYRHLSTDPEVPLGVLHGVLAFHIALALLILGWIVVQGVRQRVRHGDHRAIRTLGTALLLAVCAQVTLGVLALVAVIGRGPADPIPAWEVVVTTAHQATGALLIVLAALSAAWIARAARS
jgi:cytochrome c oxidase assembly protein subunit 15